MSVVGLEESERIAKSLQNKIKKSLSKQQTELKQEIEKLEFLLSDKATLGAWRSSPASQERLASLLARLDEVERLYLEAGDTTAARIFKERMTKELKRKLTNLEANKIEVQLRAQQFKATTQPTMLQDFTAVKRGAATRELYLQGRESGGFLSSIGRTFMGDLVTLETKAAGSKTLGAYMTNLYNTYEKKLKDVFVSGIIRGDSYQKMTQNLMSTSKITAGKANLLIRTEANAIFNDSVKTVIQKNPLVKGYRFRAVLDRRTSKICQEHDGEFIPKENIQPGVNYPPLHPNCRSTVTTVLYDEDERKDLTQRYTKNKSNQWVPVKPGTTYKEFIANINTYLDMAPQRVRQQVSQIAQPVQGRNITQNFTRDESKYRFAINQVVHQQGYDGKPTVVGKEEFDKVVKASNFIAQRTYSAPTQEMLDLYQKSLYEGEWYIDCTAGGSTYGRGMYCSANRSQTITQKMRHDMDIYIERYKESEDTKYVVETFTMQPDAKIATIQDIQDRFAGKPTTQQVEEWYKPYLDEATAELTPAEKQVFIGDILPYSIPYEEYSLARDQLTEKQLDVIFNKIDKFKSKLRPEYNKWKESLLEQAAQNSANYEDIGTYAAALGYDAIDVSRNDRGEGYYVILNRTKVVFLKGDK